MCETRRLEVGLDPSGALRLAPLLLPLVNLEGVVARPVGPLNGIGARY